MSFEVTEIAEGKVIEVALTGKLTKEAYEEFIPLTEQRIKQFGKIRMLVILHDFHGWNAGALWEDIKFDVKHFNDIERLAIVGETKWEKGMTIFCRPSQQPRSNTSTNPRSMRLASGFMLMMLRHDRNWYEAEHSIEHDRPTLWPLWSSPP